MLANQTTIAIELKDGPYQRKFKPDDSIYIKGRSIDFPTLIIEVAHSESETKLLCSGIRWLRGSAGCIRTAILIKLNYPGPITDIRLWVYRLRRQAGEKTIAKWGPKVIYRAPPGTLPEPNLSLDLSLEDIFHEYVSGLPPTHPAHTQTISIPFTAIAQWCAAVLQPPDPPARIAPNIRASLAACLEERWGEPTPEEG
jgi:hypothetical protein